MNKQKFKIWDVLSVTDGRLCGDMDGVHKVCDFITGEQLFTHSLPRAAEYVKAKILE